MRRYKNILILLMILLIFSVGTTVFAQAQFDDYVPLQPLPGVQSGEGLSGVLSGIFNLFLAVGVLLAVVMIALGGLEYMGSDVVTKKESARERMTSALLGLLILFGSVLIFTIINPQILDVDLFSNTEETWCYIETVPTGNGSDEFRQNCNFSSWSACRSSVAGRTGGCFSATEAREIYNTGTEEGRGSTPITGVGAELDPESEDWCFDFILASETRGNVERQTCYSESRGLSAQEMCEQQLADRRGRVTGGSNPIYVDQGFVPQFSSSCYPYSAVGTD